LIILFFLAFRFMQLADSTAQESSGQLDNTGGDRENNEDDKTHDKEVNKGEEINITLICFFGTDDFPFFGLVTVYFLTLIDFFIVRFVIFIVLPVAASVIELSTSTCVHGLPGLEYSGILAPRAA
jgi:hypothetical protein